MREVVPRRWLSTACLPSLLLSLAAMLAQGGDLWPHHVGDRASWTGQRARRELSISVSANPGAPRSGPPTVQRQSVVLRVRAINYLAASKAVNVTSGTQTHDFVLRRDFNRLQSS
jgi:hypothetical protein